MRRAGLRVCSPAHVSASLRDLSSTRARDVRYASRSSHSERATWAFVIWQSPSQTVMQ